MRKPGRRARPQSKPAPAPGARAGVPFSRPPRARPKWRASSEAETNAPLQCREPRALPRGENVVEVVAAVEGEGRRHVELAAAADVEAAVRRADRAEVVDAAAEVEEGADGRAAA